MDLKSKFIAFLFFFTRGSNAQCLSNYSIEASSCSYDGLVSSLQIELNTVGCNHDAVTEIQLTLGDRDESMTVISGACSEAYLPFGAITDQGNVFDKEYYDGGTYYSEQRQSINENGITVNKLSINPGDRIEGIYHDISEARGILFPDYLTNFDNCDLNAVMCCFVQDRQAGDNNGNCATPYEENCVDANPTDNTDICYVDMARTPTSSRTSDGFAVFEGEDEDDSHCHGFAWAENSSDVSARFKGNNLFYVSMYDHLTQRGYARNVPGAPMCACVEQMPVVTRADCTQIDIESEAVTFTYSDETRFSANVVDLKIEFNACQGANGNNNDLGAYYERLVEEEKISEEKRDAFEEIVVGETYCREAIDKVLDEKGYMAEPKCKYGYPSECGCIEVKQSDYRGYVNVTKSGRECQRWDSQAPHSHSRTRSNYPDMGLTGNFCRNPDGEDDGAWCYTTDPNKRWEYCHVDVCGIEPTQFPSVSPTSSSDAVCSDGDQSDYRGEMSTTEDGFDCQRWDSQEPHSHRYTPSSYPNSGLTESYCRNPSDGERAWCYTTDPNKRWQYCDIPSCEETRGEDTNGIMTDTSIMNPTVSPKPKPTAGSSCFDSPLDVLFPGGKVGCSYLASNLSYCSFPGAGSHCPFTCNKCLEYQCADSELEFAYGNESYYCSALQSLSAIARNNFCGLEEVYSTCRASCEVCG